VKITNKRVALAVVLVTGVVAAAEAAMVLVVVLILIVVVAVILVVVAVGKVVTKQPEKFAWESHIFSLYLPYRYTVRVLHISYYICYF